MINLIKVNGLEIIDDNRIGQVRIFTLKDKTTLLRKEIQEVEIWCQSCQKFYHRKLSYYHLTKKYQCNSCHSRLNNSFQGKKHSEEFKKKMSESRKGKRLNPHSKSNYQWWLEKYGEEEANKRHKIYLDKQKLANGGSNNAFYGKKHTEETIQRIISKSKITNSLKTKEEKKIISDKLKLAQQKIKNKNPQKYIENKKKAGKASHNAQGKYKINKIEKLIQDYLLKFKIDFKYAIILDKYQFDFGNLPHKILIEVQGDYWHGNPNIYKTFNHIQQKNILRDIEKEKWVTSNGYKLVTIWETDILNNNFQTLDIIEDLI